MKYFGCLKPELIEKFNGKKIANFLIKNKLYEQAIKKQYYITNEFIDEEESSDYNLNNVEDKNSTTEAGQFFNLILFEFMKSVSSQLKEQLKNDLNHYLYIGKKNKIDLNTLLINNGKNIKLEPTQILLDDFYESIIDNYNLKILETKFAFYENFNEEIYGEDFNKQKSIALKYYKELHKSLFEDNITYMPNEDYESYDLENNFFKIENKLKIVLCNKLKYQHKLATINPFYEYLTGDNSIFTKAFYIKNDKIIEEVLKYEAQKTIMVELNKKYEFEEDFYFTNRMEEKRKYEEYDEIFNSFKTYKFTDNLIKTFVEDKKANIESLYEFLRVNNLAKKGKGKFFEYLKNEHKIVLTKIVSYINYDDRKDFPVGGKKPNDEHINRVKIIEEKWALFT